MKILAQNYSFLQMGSTHETETFLGEVEIEEASKHASLSDGTISEPDEKDTTTSSFGASKGNENSCQNKPTMDESESLLLAERPQKDRKQLDRTEIKLNCKTRLEFEDENDNNNDSQRGDYPNAKGGDSVDFIPLVTSPVNTFEKFQPLDDVNTEEVVSSSRDVECEGKNEQTQHGVLSNFSPPLPDIPFPRNRRRPETSEDTGLGSSETLSTPPEEEDQSRMLDVSSPQVDPPQVDPPQVDPPQLEPPTNNTPFPHSTPRRTLAIPRRRLGYNRRYTSFRMMSQWTLGENGFPTKIMCFGYLIQRNERIYMIRIREFYPERQKSGRGIRLFVPQWDTLYEEQHSIYETFNAIRNGREISICLQLGNNVFALMSNEDPYLDIRIFTQQNGVVVRTNVGIRLTLVEWESLMAHSYKLRTELNNWRHVVMPVPQRYNWQHFHRT